MNDVHGWVSVALQVPIVGLFVWFVLKRETSYQRYALRMQESWLKESQERERQVRDFIAESRQRERDFLTEQRSALVAALVAVTDRLSRVETQLAMNTAMLTVHDATVRGTNPETIGTTEEIMDRVLGLPRSG
jgi:hypothetical protein